MWVDESKEKQSKKKAKKVSPFREPLLSNYFTHDT